MSQIRPSWTAWVTHGTTSSSISSSEVVHSMPRTARALVTSGTRFWTSCSNAGSDDQRQRPVALDLAPDHLGELGDGGRAFGRDVEVLVARGVLRHALDDSCGQVAAVGVVPHLVAGAEDVQRILALDHLLHQVRHDVAHRELDVAGAHLDVAERPPLTDTDTVERPHDRVRQLVLVPGRLREVLDGQLLEAVRRQRRRDRPLVTLHRGPVVRRLVDHRAGQVGDLAEAAGAVGGDRGVALGGHDPLVGGKQVVRVGVEVGDPADQRRAGNHVVAVGQEPGDQVDVAGVALGEVVVGVVVVGLLHGAVLRVVVEAAHGVPAPEQLLDDVAADEAGRTGDEDPLLVSHGSLSGRRCWPSRCAPLRG